MSSQHLNDISDRELLDAVIRAAGNEREATVELLRLLGEVDKRRLYLGEGCAALSARRRDAPTGRVRRMQGGRPDPCTRAGFRGR